MYYISTYITYIIHNYITFVSYIHITRFDIPVSSLAAMYTSYFYLNA